MLKTAAILFAAIAVIASAGDIPFNNCGSSSDPVTISSLSVSGKLSPGNKVSITASASSSISISDGHFKIQVKYDGLTLFKKTGDICSSPVLNMSCPISPGPVTAEGSVSIPSFAPKGKYEIQISAKNSDSSALFCVSANLNIQAGVVPDSRLHEPINREGIVSTVNQAETTWTAGSNLRFENMTLSHARHLCGTIMKGERFEQAMSRVFKRVVPIADSIPSSFDARQKWSDCSSVIGHIRDQASCGSCWAVSSTEAFNDRKCITTDGSFKTELSAQDTTSCCNLFSGCFGSMGCNGGMPVEAWTYFTKTGLVTGGDYDTIGTGSSCFPYQLANCNHHVNGPYHPCKEGGSTPSCPSPRKCTEKKYSKAWGDDKTYAKSAYWVPSDVPSIQTEIMTKGPVTAAFTVYEDFLTYKSGVYRHTTGQELGGHAVKILGWGEDNGTPYWLVANSWNKYWGDDGYFKILRGQDECGIESQIVAGDV